MQFIWIFAEDIAVEYVQKVFTLKKECDHLV